MSNNKTGLRHAMLNSDTLAGEFCEILTLDAIFGDLVQCDGGLPMPFEANVPDPSTGEMLGVAEGIGGLTEGASTSIWVPDYLGVYKEVLANNPAWEDGRVVSNYFPNSASTETSFNSSGNGVISGTEISNLSADYDGAVSAINFNHKPEGTWRSVSIYLWAEGDNIGKAMTLQPGNLGSTAITLTGTPTRYCIANENTNGFVYLRRFPGQTITAFHASQPQYEYGTQLPGEYIETSGTALTKVFAKERTVSIGANQVVTESVGAWIDPLPRLVYAPEATNICLISNFTSRFRLTGGLTVSATEGIDGAADSAGLLSDESVTETGSADNTGVNVWTIDAGDDYHSLIVWIKKKASDPGYYPIIRYQLVFGAALDYRIIVNPYDGAFTTHYDVGSSSVDVSIIDDGINWKCVLTNASANSGLANTGVVLHLRVCGSSSMASEVIDDTMTGDLTATCEFYANTPHAVAKGNPPILNATHAPVTRTARALSFDGANHDPDQSGYYFEWEPSVLEAGDEVYGVLIFDAGFTGDGFFHPNSTARLKLRQWYFPRDSEEFDDGKAGGETHHSAFVIDTDVADSLQAYDNDGAVWTTPLSSVGSIAVPGIYLGVSSPYVIKFGPIRRYQAPLDEMKAQLEADIAAGEAA